MQPLKVQGRDERSNDATERSEHPHQNDDDAFTDDEDDLDEASREELDREIEASLDEADAGQLIDANDLIAHLRTVSAGTSNANGGT